jgi:hypothetical protein
MPRDAYNSFTEAVIDNAWRIQLTNGVSVTFSGAVDAQTLRTILISAI